MLRDRGGFDREARRRALLEQLGQVGPTAAPVLAAPITPSPSRVRTYEPPPTAAAPIRRPNPFSGGYVAPGTTAPPPATFPTPSMQPLSTGQGPQRPGRPERPVGAAPPPPQAPAPPPAPGTTPEQGLSQFEQDRQDRLNRFREERGLPPIQTPPETAVPPAEGEEGEAAPATGELPEGWVTVGGLSMPSGWGAFAGPGHMEGYGVHGGPSSYGEASTENPHFGRQYQVSRILSHIDPDAEDSLEQAHAVFEKAGIAHQWDGFDRFDFGQGWVDLKHNKRFVKTGEGPNDWTYLEQGGAGGSAEAVGGRGTMTGTLGAGGMTVDQLTTLFSTDPALSQLAAPSPQFLQFLAGLSEAEQSQLIKQLLARPGETPEEEAPREEAPPTERATHQRGGARGGTGRGY